MGSLAMKQQQQLGNKPDDDRPLSGGELERIYTTRDGVMGFFSKARVSNEMAAFISEHYFRVTDAFAAVLNGAILQQDSPLTLGKVKLGIAESKKAIGSELQRELAIAKEDDPNILALKTLYYKFADQFQRSLAKPPRQRG